MTLSILQPLVLFIIIAVALSRVWVDNKRVVIDRPDVDVYSECESCGEQVGKSDGPCPVCGGRMVDVEVTYE